MLSTNPPTPACQGSPGCETDNGSPPLPPRGDHFSQKMVGFRWFPFAVRSPRVRLYQPTSGPYGGSETLTGMCF